MTHENRLRPLAEYILQADDYTAWVHLLRPPIMTIGDHEDLCHMVEACPVHFCDYRICLDDQDQTCPTGRGET